MTSIYVWYKSVIYDLSSDGCYTLKTGTSKPLSITLGHCDNLSS